jgi:hypothetical protein
MNSIRRSRGREPWVFRVGKPEELPGAHSDLIAAAIRPGERLRYLLYSPIFEARTAPFGIEAYPASHALAVGEGRFLVSADGHREGKTAQLREVFFDQVLWVELGSALLLGWLVIRFVEGGSLRSLSLFYPATGTHHFEAILRAYRSLAQTHAEAPPAALIDWPNVAGPVEPLLRERVERLMVEGERTVGLFVSLARWQTDRRARRTWRIWKSAPLCTVPSSLLLVSNLGFLYAVDEPPLRPGTLSFGVNVVAISRRQVKSAALKRASYPPLLQLTMGTGPTAPRLDLPWDDEQGGIFSGWDSFLSEG